MAEFIPKNLGEGRMPTSKGTVYTVPPGKAAIVRSISLANLLGQTVVVNIYADFGTGSRQVCPRNLELKTRFWFEHDISITLEAGDKIEMDCDTAESVDFVISGVESA